MRVALRVAAVENACCELFTRVRGNCLLRSHLRSATSTSEDADFLE